MNFKNGLRAFSTLIYPKLQKILRLKSVDDDVERFFMKMVKDTLAYRENNNVSRKDLMQLMIQLRNTGKVQNDGDWDTKITNDGRMKLKSDVQKIDLINLFQKRKRHFH